MFRPAMIARWSGSGPLNERSETAPNLPTGKYLG
jgi:hypothetical protein